LAPFATLRYEDSLMLPEDGRKAAHGYLLALGSLIVVCLLISAIIPFSDGIAELYGDPSVAAWVWTIPVVLFLNRIMKISELWLTREEKFSRITGGQVIQSTTMTAIRVGSGLVKASPAGLIFGLAIGQLAAFIYYLKRLVQTLRRSLSGPPSFDTARFMAARYRRFPLFTMPAGVLSALTTQLPALLLLYYFDLRTVGVYSQAVGIILIPLSQVAVVVTQVFFVRAVEAHRAGRLHVLAGNVHRRMVMMTLMPIVIMMIAGGDVFEFMFGARWRPSGEYVLYLGVWILFTAVSGPLTRLFDVLERQRLELLTATLMTIVIAASIIVGGRTGSIVTTLLLLGLGGAFVRLCQVLLLLRLARVSWSAITGAYLRYGFLTAPLAAGVWAATLLDSTLMTTLAAGAAGAVFGLYVLVNEKLLGVRTDS
ncbi:MAG: oligosaccharide flippase family protein, partial [Rhodothermales bacterium]|nr:oligosaccharide flippase family protein [Rhodothermales bacterium]